LVVFELIFYLGSDRRALADVDDVVEEALASHVVHSEADELVLVLVDASETDVQAVLGELGVRR
jgi:hypothetical protein